MTANSPSITRPAASPWSQRLTAAPAIVAYLAVANFLLHILTATTYGLFIDELYFLAAGEHLAWGYVDMPPAAAFLAWLARTLFGGSQLGIRLIPALAAAGLVVITGLIVAQLRGGRLAQLLAGLAVIMAGFYMTVFSFLSMNAVEPLIWMGCALLLIRLINTEDPRWWLAIGVVAGLGTLNKETVFVFGLALLGGLLLTPARRLLFNRWALLGGALAFLIFLPNLIWMAQHGFPMLELLANIRRNQRNVPLDPLQFIVQQAVWLHPVTLPLWLAGLWYFFFSRPGRAYRVLGWTYVLALAILLATQGRVYYLAPIYPMLFAGGALAGESWSRTLRLRWPVPVYAGILTAAGVIAAPLFMPVLAPETYIRYAAAVNFAMPQLETHDMGALPQLFADRFGWPEMAAATARAFHALSPEEQAQTAIFAGNYGQAGAIDFYGPALGLPKAISGHLNYYYWGPRAYTGASVLTLGMARRDLAEICTTIEQVGVVGHLYAMPSERFPIYHCRGLKVPLDQLWPQAKNWS